MGKIESIMKQEIARLARREIRGTVNPLKKEVTRLRKLSSHLARTVAVLDREAQHRRKADLARLGNLSAAEEEVEGVRINGRWVKTLRRKLNVSQSELAALAEISVSGVRAWEYGISKPRGRNRAALVALRKLGRREVKRMLEERAGAEES